MKHMVSQSIVLCFSNLGRTLNGPKQCTSCLSHFIPRKRRPSPTEQETVGIGSGLDNMEGGETLGHARIHNPDHPHCSTVTISTTLFKLPSGVTRNIYHSCCITFNLLEDGDLGLSQGVVM